MAQATFSSLMIFLHFFFIIIFILQISPTCYWLYEVNGLLMNFFSVFSCLFVFLNKEIDAKAGGGQPITIGVMVRQLLTKLDWYDTLFPRIPVPIQMSIDSKLVAKFPAVRQPERHEPVASRENRGDWRREENAVGVVRSRDCDRREEREERKLPRVRSRSRERSRDRRRDRGDTRDRDREQRNRRDRERDRGQRDRYRGQRERSRSRDRKRRDDRR